MELPLDRAWKGLAGRAGASLGALTALLSLLRDAPVLIACLRGAGVFAAVLLLSRIGAAALDRAVQVDASEDSAPGANGANRAREKS